ncbi:MAG: permease prefix domain 1-containing protein [Acidimicrobiia bacterium]|nr:permease prefix domain 1-containing protein [Acidimicrobiia bacterium]
MTIATVESQIAEWRRYVSAAPAVDGRDVDELEDHLRHQILELGEAGLSEEEAFLVAVKRLGDIDALSREFAREHSSRLWKQLVLRGEPTDAPGDHRWVMPIGLAVASAVAIQMGLRIGGFPNEPSAWIVRNLAFFVLPFLAAYFAVGRRLEIRGLLVTAAPFVGSAILVNLYPIETSSAIDVLVALHLPVLLWFGVAYPYTGGRLGSQDGRMDFVRFTGEWFIYFVLIALGGGVLMALTGLILEPIDPDLGELVIEWMLPSGAAGAVIVAAWLVESKQQVVENMAPVLTMIFSPLFAVMLTVAAVTYAVTGVAGDFDRELLGLFDLLLVVVLGLVLYALSARESGRQPGVMDGIQLVAVLAALVLDGLVLGAMLARIADLGFTPNRVAALGLNIVLLVNLAATAWMLLRSIRKRVPPNRLVRWQTAYLPVFALWAAAVVIVLPPVFGFS